MAITKTAETKIYLGTDAAITTAPDDYAGDTFTEIKWLIEAGELGGTTERGTVDHVSTGLREVYKATTDLGEMELSFSYDADDAGQAAVEEAYSSDAPHNFKIELSNGDIFYFRSLIMSSRIATGTNDEHVRLLVNIAHAEREPTYVAA